MNKTEKRISVSAITIILLFLSYQIAILTSLQTYSDKLINDIPSAQILSSKLSPLKRSIQYKIAFDDIEIDTSIKPNLLGTKLTLASKDIKQDKETPDGASAELSADYFSISAPLSKPLIFSNAEVMSYMINSKDLKISGQRDNAEVFSISVDNLAVFIPSALNDQSIEANLESINLGAKSAMFNIDVSQSVEKIALSIDPQNTTPSSIEMINSKTTGQILNVLTDTKSGYVLIKYTPDSSKFELKARDQNSTNLVSFDEFNLEIENKVLTYVNIVNLSVTPEYIGILAPILNLGEAEQQYLPALSPINILYKDLPDLSETSIIFTTSAWSGNFNVLQEDEGPLNGKLTAQFTENAKDFFNLISDERVRSFMQNCATLTYSSQSTGSTPVFFDTDTGVLQSKLSWTNYADETTEDYINIKHVDPQSMQLNINDELFDLALNTQEVEANISSPAALGIISLMVDQPDAKEAILSATLPAKVTIKSI
jgi:hypothetical protein